MTNQKYEITDIVHEKYPFLHRIRALRDIGSEVKTGDLGGFVAGEWNLSYEDGDSWIFDDAIAANVAFVYEGACLRDQAIACGEAHICKGAVLSSHARAEDHAHIERAVVSGSAQVSGTGTIFSTKSGKGPILSGNCYVLGHISGNVRVTGDAVIFGDERIIHSGIDTIVINESGRHIERSPDRDILRSGTPWPVENKRGRKRGQSR